ncbi:MAG TPA: glycosyltransferase family 39 protein [Vicinamibacterales bacterium]
MTRRQPDFIHALRALLVSVGAAYLLAYTAVALARMAFPFDIEVLEGTILDHVHRVLLGQNVYPPPSLDFVATMYAPGYYYVSAAVAAWLGEGFLALRLVSFLSSIAVMAIIFAFVWRETRDRFAAFLAVCLFAATFRRTGAWFDIARPDSLFLAFLMTSVYRLRFARGRLDAIVAGVAFAAACVTKQTALLLGVPMVVAVVWWDRRRAVAFMATAGVLVAVAGLALEYSSGGWFSRHTLVTTPLVMSRLWTKWFDLVWPVPIACLAAVWLIRRGRSHFADSHAFQFVVALTVGWFVATVYVEAHASTAENALIPFFAWLAVVFGLALHRLSIDAWGRRHMPAVYALALLQFAGLVYNPVAQVPTASDRAGGMTLVDAIRSADGPVLVFERPYLARLAGKPGHAGRVPLLVGPRPYVGRIRTELEARIRTGQYGAVVVVEPEGFASALAARYLPAELILAANAVPVAVAGGEPNPNLLFRPKPVPTR